jgi:hypothetical protein
MLVATSRTAVSQLARAQTQHGSTLAPFHLAIPTHDLVEGNLCVVPDLHVISSSLVFVVESHSLVFSLSCSPEILWGHYGI